MKIAQRAAAELAAREQLGEQPNHAGEAWIGGALNAAGQAVVGFEQARTGHGANRCGRVSTLDT